MVQVHLGPHRLDVAPVTVPRSWTPPTRRSEQPSSLRLQARGRAGPWGTVDMIKVGGTYKYVTDYYSLADLLAFPFKATYEGQVRGKVQLVVSHGCAPFVDDGAWCSPGYWRNARDAAWARTGYAKSDLFNAVVVPTFLRHAIGANPTLIQVLTSPGANTFGAADAPYGSMPSTRRVRP